MTTFPITAVEGATSVDSTDLDKRFATIAAHLALRGFALHRLSCGGYLIARWDRTAYAPDLRGVDAFLERVGG